MSDENLGEIKTTFLINSTLEEIRFLKDRSVKILTIYTVISFFLSHLLVKIGFENTILYGVVIAVLFFVISLISLILVFDVKKRILARRDTYLAVYDLHENKLMKELQNINNIKPGSLNLFLVLKSVYIFGVFFISIYLIVKSIVIF